LLRVRILSSCGNSTSHSRSAFFRALSQSIFSCRQNFESAAGKSDAGEIIWAWFAARQLPAFDQSQWTVRLESTLEQVTATAGTSGLSGLWAYNSAMLNRALGREQEAKQGFQQVFLLPDRLLSYHLTREALTTQ